MEQDRISIETEIAEAQQASVTADIISAWSIQDVQRMLASLSDHLSATLEEGQIRELRAALADLIERIEYEPETRQATIYYRLTGFNKASPRGCGVDPESWSRVADIGKRLLRSRSA